MADPLFKQLTEIEVPPVPAGLDEQVHRRLNTTLLITHLFTFCWHALPYALGVLLGSVMYLLEFTATGRMNEDADRQPPNNE